jgi:alanyl-tRNA synthetase
MPSVIGIYKDVYPELSANILHISNTLKTEGTAFFRTLNDGEQRLQELIKSNPGKICGSEVFSLYETYGFPFELTKEILSAKNIEIDEQGFYDAREEAKKSSKADADDFEKEKIIILQELESKYKPTVFTGYESLTEESIVISLLDKNYKQVDVLQDEGFVILDKTPFYAESGGQVGDIGLMEKNGEIILRVLDTQRPLEKLFLHKVAVIKDNIKTGQKVTAKVDVQTRLRTASNHTAVHVINAALKKILGENVRQAGSFVSPQKLRFDYTVSSTPTPEQMAEVWNIANDIVAANLKVQTQVRPLKDARELNATILLGENYADPARFVIMAKDGFREPLNRISLELCGGTHVKNTGEIMVIRPLKDSAVSAGVRRIEAVAGLSAVDYLKETADKALFASKLLNTSAQELDHKIESMLKTEKDLRKEIADMRRKLLSGAVAQTQRAEIILENNIAAIAFNAENTEIKELRNLADNMSAKNQGKVIIISTDKDGKKSFVVKSFTGGPNAGEICKKIAAAINGRGGGRPDFAQGGGERLAWEEFVKKIKEI